MPPRSVIAAQISPRSTYSIQIEAATRARREYVNTGFSAQDAVLLSPRDPWFSCSSRHNIVERRRNLKSHPLRIRYYLVNLAVSAGMSRQVLDNLLANIEERASTVDPFETNSSRSTIVGLGAAAGKLIMHVGIGVIRGATYANRRVVLARIAAAQEHVVTRLDGAQYRDILEYQRFVFR